LGGTNATTAAAAIQNLLPSYTGNGSKRLGLNSGATALEWVADGGGTVTSVDFSGGTTGLTATGGPITSSGTITLAGTLAVANGGTNGTATPIAGTVSYGTGTAYAFTAAGTVGQILQSNGAAAPTWANLSSLGVSSFSAGSTGLLPSTGTTGAITLSGTLIAFNGGTGQSNYAVGDLLYASSTTALSKLADVATGNALISGGVSTAPSWGKIGLTTHVSGTLPTANGGTNLTSFTANGVLYASSTSALATGSALTFDGTNFNAVSSSQYPLISVASTAANNIFGFRMDGSTGSGNGRDWRIEQGRNAVGQFNITDITAGNTVRYSIGSDGTAIWNVGAGTGSEAMRLNSTGLGIGTSSPTNKLAVVGNTTNYGVLSTNPSGYGAFNLKSATVNQTWSFIANDNGANSDLLIYGGSSAGTKLTLDSSGNLGLGVTPSAWGSSVKAIQIGARTGVWNLSDNTYFSTNSYFDGTNSRYIGTQFATMYSQQNDGAHKFYVAPSGTAGNTISFTQAMTLDASGNLLVGATTANNAKFAVNSVPNGTAGNQAAFIAGSKSAYAGYAQLPQGQLFVYDNTGSSAGTGGAISFGGDAGGGQQTWYAAIEARKDNSTAGDYGASMVFYTRPSGTTAGERMRIDSSGNLRLGVTVAAYNTEKLTVFKAGNVEASAFINDAGANNYTVAVSNRGATGDNKFIVFATESSDTTRGSIVYNRASGLTTYNQTSDYRAKDIYGPVQNPGALIDSVPVYMGKMKDATQERPMFIAHETPVYAHTGEKDAVDVDGKPVYQQMDASALIPVMWAEIQSLRKRLAAAGI
jgi:hypothetical protein